MRKRSPTLIGLVLLAAHLPLLAQQTTLKVRVELELNGRRAKDVSNAVVWLTPLGVPVEHLRQWEIPRLTQKNKNFHPALVVVPVGGQVEFPNDDPFFHNVFSLFEGKRFDLGLYEGGSTRFVQFDRPGISYIFCNIHAQMSAVVVALSTPYFGISGANGEVAIMNVPAGRYRMQVFHASALPEDLQALSREVTVMDGDSSLGVLRIQESSAAGAHKNKYGREYDPPSPDSPVYARP